ncbi:hypothetical protein FOZ76_08535 [Verticiella sediminum]|uniref:Uncharacterized protein n=1 Tax=Verticiella sediminum TaxID=1247510 RepID=A0A556AUK3_9BURK|nr:hypothetical protein [Verticiella sediminum]TSH96617.1 hypothetical protein FOZ76_08535 [Verticiella sediminum]
MTLRGSAFLPIWHDVDVQMEDEFNVWHTVEHIPERVDTPGIVVGRRYADPDASLHRYFTLYEAESFEVFASDGYFATANARSDWTQRVHPAFRNFRRAPCHLFMTRGRGIGGGLATARIHFAQPGAGAAAPRDVFSLAGRRIVDGIAKLRHVTSVHLGIVGRVERRPLSEQSLSLRPQATAFDAVLMAEGIGLEAMRAAAPDMEAILHAEPDAVGGCEVATYGLAYMLFDISGR